VVSYLRKGRSTRDLVLIVCNFTPVARRDYHVGVPVGGPWKEILNSDALEYGGGGLGNAGAAEAVPVPFHGQGQSLSLRLPPLAVLIFKKDMG